MKRVVCVVLIGCGPKGGVVNFKVPPGPICAGQIVDVSWEVDGPAKLKAEPPPPDWPAGEVDVKSKDSKPATLSQDTTFTVTAVDGDAAKGTAYKSQPVSIAKPTDDRRAQVTCTGTSCTGQFTIPPPGDGMTVSALGLPRVTAGGRTHPMGLCVEHAGMAKTCIDPLQHATVNVAAAGTWTLEADVPEGEAPPAAFTVEVGFACQR